MPPGDCEERGDESAIWRVKALERFVKPNELKARVDAPRISNRVAKSATTFSPLENWCEWDLLNATHQGEMAIRSQLKCPPFTEYSLPAVFDLSYERVDPV